MRNGVLVGKGYMLNVPGLMESASMSLRVAQYAVQHAGHVCRDITLPLVDKLIAKRRDGVVSRVLLNAGGAGKGLVACNLAVAAYWQAAGVEVRWPDQGRIAHAKLVIVDLRLAVVGSHNWTVSALRDNIEVSVVVDDPDVVALLAEHFDVWWSVAHKF